MFVLLVCAVHVLDADNAHFYGLPKSFPQLTAIERKHEHNTLDLTLVNDFLHFAINRPSHLEVRCQYHTLDLPRSHAATDLVTQMDNDTMMATTRCE